MSQLDWDGQPLGAAYLALSLLKGDVAGDDDETGALLFATSTGNRRCIVKTGQLAAFLRIHREASLVCYGVGPFFWAIEDELRRIGDRAALEVLWDLPRSGRLLDIELLDQLVQMAERPHRLRASSLRELADRHLGMELGDEESLRGRLASPGSGPSHREDPLLHEIARRADVELGVYRVLREAADRIIRRLDIAPETVAKFGPLALKLQVQGAIALAAARRCGLHLDDDAKRRIVEACDAARRTSADELWGYTEARRCFKQVGEQFKLSSTGFLVPRETSLKSWLRSLGDSLTGIHAIPLIVPERPEGGPETDPTEWGIWARCHPPLRAWAVHVEASRLRRYFERHEGTLIHPEYQVLPDLRSVAPDLKSLRRLVPDGIFSPSPGHSFLVVTLRDLELRALAAVLERRHGTDSELARVFREGRDPHTFAAARFFNTDEAGFESIKTEQPGLHLHWARVARALHFAVPRGLGADQLREIAARDFQVELDGAEAHDLQRRMIDEVYPEWGVALNDDTIRVLAASLGTTPERCWEALRLPPSPGDFPLPDTTRAALRRVILGQDPPRQTRGYEEWRALTWERLRRLNCNPALTPLLESARGSRELFERVFRRDAVTLTGRVRTGLGYAEGHSYRYQALADDALMAALFALVAAGHRLVGISGTATVLEIPHLEQFPFDSGG